MTYTTKRMTAWVEGMKGMIAKKREEEVKQATSGIQFENRQADAMEAYKGLLACATYLDIPFGMSPIPIEE